MAEFVVQGSGLGNALTEMLTCPDIEPGDQPSYELCKTIWLYHPLGKKMVEGPVAMAQSQAREISVTDGPENMVRDRFAEQWEKDLCDEWVYNVASVARAYGIGTLALIAPDFPANEPIPPDKLGTVSLTYSVYDPLNTAGSMVLNQNPLSIDFMKVTNASVGGVTFHRSRTVTIMNERPVYIAYTTSAFGFVGRSVFQRALFPLKSFVQTMLTDDLITKKAGVFIATLKAAGSIIDAMMQQFAGLKRIFIKEASITNANVISIGPDEKIETLNMQNIDGAYGMARKNVLENIATAADMPAIILKQETFAEGFGEGTEDAKLVAGYISQYRRTLRPVYDFLDPIIQRRAWTPEWYLTVQAKHEDWRDVTYEEAYFRFATSFSAIWPNLLTEPDSEKVKTDDVRLKAVIATIEVFGPMMDPENKALLFAWAQDIINQNQFLFQSPLALDIEALRDFEPPQQAQEPGEPKPFAAQDSAAAAERKRMRKLTVAEVEDLVSMMERKPSNLPPPAKRNGHFAPGVGAWTR